jgi:membrane protease YdiL (CAAX protease family)
LLFFGFGSLVWLVTLSVVLFVAQGEDTADTSITASLVVSAAALLGFVALAYVLSATSSLVPKEVFGWKSRPLGVWVGAFLAGLTMGPFGGWLAERLVALSEFFSADHLEEIARLIYSGSSASRALAMILVLVLAPLFEELLFRGFIWDCLERSLGSGAALVSSSLLFALYHADPLHVVSVLPLSLLLGTLRLGTGSIVPCIAAHFGNNLLSMILLMVWGVEETVVVPWVVAALCLTISLVAVLRSGALAGGPARGEE